MRDARIKQLMQRPDAGAIERELSKLNNMTVIIYYCYDHLILRVLCCLVYMM